MIRNNSLLEVTDNSGALIVKAFGMRRQKHLNIFRVSVVKIDTAIKNSKVKKGQIFFAQLVRQAYPQEIYGGIIAKSSNAVILLNEKKEPLGTRISGFVSRKNLIQSPHIKKILAMSKEVVG